MLSSSRSIVAQSLTLLLMFFVSTNTASDASDYFKMTVVVKEAGRGVPLVELKPTMIKTR